MKKILAVFAIVAIAAVTAKADYLYWQVSSDQFTAAGITDATYQYSMLYSYDSDTSTFTKLAGNWGTGENSFYFDANNASTYQDLTYYVELASYANGASEASYTPKSTLQQSDGTGFSYSQIHLTSATSMSAIKSTWSGATRRDGAVPEPTSGLMMLVGMALLGLKRRRA